MIHALSPGLILAVLFVLIGAQTARLLAPERGSYLWAVVLACGGVIAGEVLAVATGAGGPTLGPLHPLPDALAIGVLETVGALLVHPRRSDGPA